MSVIGGLSVGTGLGVAGLGTPQAAQNFAFATMAKQARPYIAHLYSKDLAFKRLLGAATVNGLVNKPDLKLTQNGGYQQIVLEVASPLSNINLGDVIRLSEQGDNAGTILFSGNVETVPEHQAPGDTHHLVTVTPWVAELGDGYFDKTYSTATDVAQFVRDAVAQTAHCSVSPVSCPDTGITAVYDFQQTNPLDAIHVARQIAGAMFFYFVDAQGVVWFQRVNTANPATITLRKGADFNEQNPVATTAGMKNKLVIAGSNTSDGGQLTSTYNGATNQAAYGVKTYNPTLVFPNVTDQPTLDAIAASLGALYDRVLHSNELTVPALGLRLTPGRPGGTTVRVWEPSKEALQESGDPGLGGYGPILILQDVEVSGPSQKLVIADIPFTDIDPHYEAARVAQRISVVSATPTPIPALAPPVQAPPATTTVGKCSSGHVTYAEGGGVVTIASATFTTSRAGTCQVQGAIDARMIAWDNYVSAPRRSVRAVLSGSVFTGSWQELPFGLTRATYDLSSASGLSLPAGTYTVSIQIDTVEYNQMEVFSSWAQVSVTS